MRFMTSPARALFAVSLVVTSLIVSSSRPASSAAAVWPAPTGALVWTVAQPMPTPRAGLGVTTAGSGTLYAVGGTDTNGANLTVTEAYDPVANVWSRKADLPTGRF